MANCYDVEVGAPRGERLVPEHTTDTMMYCKLFGDVVQDEVCGLRRRVLASRSGFSCKGCIVNITLDANPC